MHKPMSYSEFSEACKMARNAEWSDNAKVAFSFLRANEGKIKAAWNQYRKEQIEDRAKEEKALVKAYGMHK